MPLKNAGHQTGMAIRMQAGDFEWFLIVES
jgi:hypothetical protein